MSALTLANGSVLVEGRFVRADVVIDDGRIVSVGAGAERRGQIVDCQGLYVVPGLIDLQVNGGGGKTFSRDIDESSYESIARAHAATGTTALCPTITSAPPEEMLAATSLAATSCERVVDGGAAFVGIHVEGPFLSAEERGPHRSEHLRAPSLDLARELVAAGRGWLRMVTLAPELEGALPVIEYLAAQGIHVSAGHTSGGAATLYEAMAHGLTGVTHLLNSMAPMRAQEPGPVGVALGSSLYAGLIGDLVHVSPDVVRAVLRARPLGHTYLVSNAAAPLGTGVERFELDGETVTVRDGACYSSSGRLAGSATPLSRMVRNLIRELETTVETAVAMASAVPAQLLGLRDRGDIRPGGTADVLVIERFKVRWVVLRGSIIEAWPAYHRL